MKLMATRRPLVAAGAVAASLAIALTGCGRSSSTPTSTGSSTAPGFNGSTITLGVLGVTSGALAQPAETLLHGEEAYYDAINAAGGIDGKYKVKLDVMDTAYDPTQATQLYASSKDSVLAYTQVFGTAIEDAVIKQLDADNILSIPSSSDGTLLQQPSAILTGNVGEVDAISIVGYATGKGGHRNDKICYAAMEGELGVSFGKALTWAERQDHAVAGISTTVPDSGDYTPQVQALKAAGCKVVVEKGSGVVLNQLITDASQLGYAPAWYAPATDWTPSMKDSPLGAYLTKNLTLIANAPVYGDTSVPGMAAMMAAHDKYTPKDVPVWLWTNGYASAMVMTDVIKKAIGMGDLSRARLQKALNSLTALDYDGVQATQPWGTPGERGFATNYSVVGVDTSTDTGLKAIVSNLNDAVAKGFKVGQ